MLERVLAQRRTLATVADGRQRVRAAMGVLRPLRKPPAPAGRPHGRGPSRAPRRRPARRTARSARSSRDGPEGEPELASGRP
jgi:hypothetical protein